MTTDACSQRGQVGRAVDRAERIPSTVASVRDRDVRPPGPVVLALPEDVLATAPGAADLTCASPVVSARPKPTCERPTRSRECARHCCWSGSRGRRRECLADAFARRHDLPGGLRLSSTDLIETATQLRRRRRHRRQSGAGHAHPRCRRPPVIGERLGEITTTATRYPRHRCRRRPDPRPSGGRGAWPVYQPAVAIAATPAAFLAALAKFPALPGERWRASTMAAHAEYEAWRMPRPVPATWISGSRPLAGRAASRRRQYSQRCRQLQRRGCTVSTLSPTGDANSRRTRARWATAFPPRWPQSSCIRSERRFVERRRLLLMNGQELATAVQNGANVVFVVIDNGMYGTIGCIRSDAIQRVVAAVSSNPDFAALARAFGRMAKRAAHGSSRRPSSVRSTPGCPPCSTWCDPAGADR